MLLSVILSALNYELFKHSYTHFRSYIQLLFFDLIHLLSNSFKCFLQMLIMTHYVQAFICFITDFNKALSCS